MVTYVFAALDLVITFVATGHVLLFKRDTRAAIGWIALIWLSPILGATACRGQPATPGRSTTLRHFREREETRRNGPKLRSAGKAHPLA
jgi:hypothetical protein